ncbi:MAG TPA: hypothetical protein EYP71_01455 [Dehalococcoidia bacterium]|nr:hypothetical protein [Dehalococcoidia bacterium]
MKGAQIARFSDKDILFLLETVDSSLMSKVDIIKNDPAIVEGMMEYEAGKLVRRIMLESEEKIMASVTPQFLFEVLLRNTRKELESRAYTIERTATQKIPVFDIKDVIRFLSDNTILKYMADMLSSFTRIESFALPIRVKRGVWRKIRFNDMDFNSLEKLCQVVPEEHRFSFYKRIADLCLFVVGIFPEYVTVDYDYAVSGGVKPRLFGNLRRSAEEYEEKGRRFYRLASEHRDAAILDLVEPLQQLHQCFNLAKKPLNYVSERYLRLRKQRLFPSSWSS